MILKELHIESLEIIGSIVLKLLSEKEKMYGYEITITIENMTAGKMDLTYDAIYPVLLKLENEGIIYTESEVVNNRIRIYYSLVDKMQSAVEQLLEELKAFIETIKTLINSKL